MNYFSVIPLSSFVVTLVLWVYIFALYRTNKTARAYLYFLTICGLWALSDFFIWSLSSERLARIGLHIQAPLWISSSFLYLNFFYRLLKKRDNAVYRFFQISVAISIIITSFTSLTITGIQKFDWGVMPILGPLYFPILIVSVILPVIYFIGFSFINFKNLETILKKQLILTAGGIFIVFVASVYINVFVVLIQNYTSMPSLGSSFTAIQVIFIFIAIVKYEFLAPGPIQAANNLFSNSNDGMLILNLNHEIVQINNSAEKFFCIENGDVFGVEVENVIAEPYSFDQDYDKLEINIPCDEIVKSAIISQIPLLNGKLLIGKLLILHDVTEKKASDQKRAELEKEVNESQDKKMRALGQLAGGIAHDFNNMLNGILGFTNILKSDMKENETTHREYLQNIENITLNAASLTRQMLTFAKKNTGEKKVLNLLDSIKSAVEIISHSIDKKISINVESSKDSLRIKGEDSQIENMLINLALNSSDAMPEGGALNISIDEILLETSTLPTDIGYVRPGKYVMLIVSDTGIGMDEETMKRVFEPFYTTKAESGGTGLGLASVYGIVQQHHGYISVESKPSKGTTFSIYFPLCEKYETRSEPITSETRSVGVIKKDSYRVMIIDDELTILKSTSVLLKRSGYTVDAFDNGVEGIEHFKELHQSLDAIILDQTMPGLSGYECYSEFRKINPEVPVILTSGYNSSVEFESLIENGAVHFLTKPYQHKELSALLSRVQINN